MACGSASVAEKSPPVVEEPPAFEELEENEPVLDTFTVSREMYDATLAEVRHFVEDLNSSIQNKDYNAWKNALSDALFAHVSSPEFLAQSSRANLLRARKIVLRTPNDYFLYVVVPSRSNSKVDDIDFMDENRVKVYSYDERTIKTADNTSRTEIRRLRLYELVRYENTWKIID